MLLSDVEMKLSRQNGTSDVNQSIKIYLCAAQEDGFHDSDSITLFD